MATKKKVIKKEVKPIIPATAPVQKTLKDDFILADMPEQKEVVKEIKIEEEAAPSLDVRECPFCGNLQELNPKRQDFTTDWCKKCGKAFLIEWKLMKRK